MFFQITLVSIYRLDLLCSAIQSCSENGWDLEEVIQLTIDKILRRQKQYKTLGRKRRIVIQGGAFNMVHNGHIEASKIVLNHSSDFDEVWLTPCFSHLYGKQLESPSHRLEMCRIASHVDARIKVFDYEIAHEFQGETYHFMKLLLNDSAYKDLYSFSIMIGLDNANTIEQWSNYEDLLKIVPFIVINRQGYEFKADWCLQSPHRYIDPDVPPVEISSTDLRSLCHEKKFDLLTTYVDKDVTEYIKANHLYSV